MVSISSHLEEYVALDQLRNLFDDFYAATGLSVSLIAYANQDVLIRVGWRNLCTEFYRKHSVASQKCRESNKDLVCGLEQTGDYVIRPCQNGIVDGCTPIIVDGIRLADLFIGQLFFEPPDLNFFRQQAQSYGFDEAAFLASLKDLPIIPQNQFTAMLRCLARSVQLIVNLNLVLKSKIAEERKLFAHGPAVVIVWKPGEGWPVEYVSENVETVLGYAPKEILHPDFRFIDLVHPDDLEQFRNEVELFIAHKLDRFDQSYRLRKKDGTYRWFYDSTVFDWDAQGSLKTIHGYIIDQTKQKEAEQKLVSYHQELELRVSQRTKQLEETNKQLAVEVDVQRQLQKALSKSEIELERERAALEESNITLRVLMKQAEQERKLFEEQVSTNLISFIEPYLEKLKKTDLNARQVNYVAIIDEHLRNISSPFVRTSMAMALRLTPAELQVANLIRQGKTSKQIADLLSISQLTVDKQRSNIRKKIGLTNQKVNLKTFLNSKMGSMSEFY